MTQQKHALLVGIDDYDNNSGLTRLRFVAGRTFRRRCFAAVNAGKRIYV